MTHTELRALDEKEWREQEEAERNRRHIKRVLDIEKVKAYFSGRYGVNVSETEIAANK